MNRTQPPPGFHGYLGDFDGKDCTHDLDTDDNCVPLARAWELYDEWTLPARVELLRELAIEFTDSDSDLHAFAISSDPCVDNSTEIAIELRDRALRMCLSVVLTKTHGAIRK